jgi:hypothetical protein
MQQEIALANNQKTDRANVQFAKLQRADEAKKALSDYETDRVAMVAKTERLRALRAARDAAELLANPKVPGSKAKKSVRAKKAGLKPEPLSNWLDGQDVSGRRR